MTKLQRAIKETYLDDKTLAKVLKLSVPTIKRWRSGKNRPHKYMLPSLLKSLEEIRIIIHKK